VSDAPVFEIGAAVGGVLFDSLGGHVTFLSSAAILVMSGLVAFAAGKVHAKQRAGASFVIGHALNIDDGCTAR